MGGLVPQCEHNVNQQTQYWLMRLSAGSNGSGIFDGATARFSLVMLVFNMFAKAASFYYFQHLYRSLAAELVGRAKQAQAGTPNRRASTQLALTQASLESRVSAKFANSQPFSPMSKPTQQQQQQQQSQLKEVELGSPKSSDGSEASFGLSPGRTRTAEEHKAKT